jgi:hypothetical protein
LWPPLQEVEQQVHLGLGPRVEVLVPGRQLARHRDLVEKGLHACAVEPIAAAHEIELARLIEHPEREAF